MEYTLLDEIIITRPILFLCGPYYEKANKSDRRVILQEMLYDTYKKKYLPLVIDDFLTEEKIQDDSISIQIMEEICAAVSYKTYIFLDTISAATELGIFANSAYFNQIEVFIPKASDIYNRKNVGYFVHDVVLKKHSDRVKCLEYRPGLERKALATDYVVEHYKFVNDRLPLNIAESIKKDPIFGQEDSHPIHLIDDDSMPRTPYQICFQKKGSSLTVSISLRLLFYVAVSVISHEYKEFLSSKDKDFSQFDIDFIMEKVNQCIKNFIAGKTGRDMSGCCIDRLNTVLKTDERTLIFHITKFVHVYYLYSQFHRFFLVDKPLGSIIDEIQVGNHPYTLLGITEEETVLLEDILQNKEKYYERIVVRKNRKEREIIKYRDDENGERARTLHSHMLRGLEAVYMPSEFSYAYCRGRSIRQCAGQHLGSRAFLKYDIRKFFNSISLKRLVKSVAVRLNIDERFQKELYLLLDSCFYEEVLPLGLILSPILSDIYMNEFDRRIAEKFAPRGFVYTRYADDILLSRQKKVGPRLQRETDSFLEKELQQLGLSFNKNKLRRVWFQEQGNYIRYVGLNIVCGEKGNFLTVGKTYAYQTAKEYLEYLSCLRRLNEESLTEEEKEKLKQAVFYRHMRLIGKLGFLQQIEGERGIARVEARLQAHQVSVRSEIRSKKSGKKGGEAQPLT